MFKNTQNLLKSIGPGILFAGAAIGGSHLVQSTRAGADYGFKLLWLVLLANFLKYPFFEYGQRYSMTTGKTLLEGYLELGKPVLYLFFVLLFLLAIVNSAAVTLVTAALAAQVIGLGLDMVRWSGVLFVAAGALIIFGSYKWLDKSVKIVIALLTVSTVAALGMALGAGSQAAPGYEAPSLWTLAGISFLVALLGWMPAPIEGSVWSSLWSLERARETGYRPTLAETNFDFNLGYILTAVLAAAFVGLGALVMFGTGAVFSDSGIRFAGQVIDLYTKTLGGWSGPVIAAAALTTMVSTTLTVIDAYPRTLASCVCLFSKKAGLWERRIQWGWMFLVCGLAMLVIVYFMNSMKAMIDFATTVSFLAAPVFAWMNYKVVTDSHMPEAGRPSAFLRIWSWAGIGFLFLISAVFLVWQLVLPYLGG